MTSDSGPERKFWQIALADLERQLGAGPNGLSSAEACRAPAPLWPQHLGGAAASVSAAQIPQSVPQPARDHSAGGGGDFRAHRRSDQLHHHFDDRADERGARYRAGISRRGGRRITQGFGGAQGAGLARRAGGDGAGAGSRPRRCRAARRRGSGPGGWASPRGQGFFRQRGIADGRVLPSGEARAR